MGGSTGLPEVEPLSQSPDARSGTAYACNQKRVPAGPSGSRVAALCLMSALSPPRRSTSTMLHTPQAHY